jgi:hypothetical protein
VSHPRAENTAARSFNPVLGHKTKVTRRTGAVYESRVGGVSDPNRLPSLEAASLIAMPSADQELPQAAQEDGLKKPNATAAKTMKAHGCASLLVLSVACLLLAFLVAAEGLRERWPLPMCGPS